METQAYLSTGGSVNLVVLEAQQVRNFPLHASSRWTIGRSTPVSSSDIPLESAIVGRQHGEFVGIDGTWYYIDKGSINGTYLNGEKIQNQPKCASEPKLLKNGDILRIDSEDLNAPDNRGVWMMFTTDSIGNMWNSVPLDGKKEIFIGRDASLCDIVFPFSYISAKHACIGFANGHYFITDCGSLAGTWLNGKRIEHGEILREKDEIRLCDCNLIFTGNALIYNVKEQKKDAKYQQGKVILQADIETKKVGKGRHQKEIIRDIHINVKEGSLVALLGGSGAGKTTIMNCMNGMETAGVEGRVLFKGVDLVTNFKQMQSLIGSVPQENVFHEIETVENELRHRAKLLLPRDTKKSELEERIDKTLQSLNLSHVRKNRISKCSGGEQKRVNVAMELVGDKQFLCLDEPDAGLDPANKKELFLILQKLAHEEGKIILVIIHDVSDIDLFDQVIMMAKVDNVGRLAISASPSEVRERFKEDIKSIYTTLDKNPKKYVK